MAELKLIPFNLNEYVHVRLTQLGRDILNPQMPGGQRLLEEADKNNNVIKLQMWESMQIFGLYMNMGGIAPIEMNVQIEVKLPEEPLTEEA